MATFPYQTDLSLHGKQYLSERNGGVRMQCQKFITASIMQISELQRSHPWEKALDKTRRSCKLSKQDHMNFQSRTPAMRSKLAMCGLEVKRAGNFERN